MHRSLSFLVLPTALAVSSLAANATAHISLEGGGTHLSRYGDGKDNAPVLKDPPCGVLGGKRGTHIYTYAPGQTIDVTVEEYVPHPSYFRLAFDVDGDDGFKDPASILPIDPTRACPDGPGDHCGASDFYNTPEVLPGMDNLNPHIPTIADVQNPPKYTWHVTFPNVECDNCTLQVIQVMEDDLFHGPYDPTPGVGVADVYHQCIDIVLKADAGNGGSGGQPGSGAGGVTGTAGVTGTGGEGGSSATGSGGTTTAVGGGNGGNAGGTSVGSNAGGAVSGVAGSPFGLGGHSTGGEDSTQSGGCAVTARSSTLPAGSATIAALVISALRVRRRRFRG
ncbi:MAG TPA: SCE4755 family polysaccharide monooxygenase-like protein [Polyangiaceae bacterium]|nr:SCE4755 family polysaccharide monooxygenase-like protein [Polyangiaceae bacterium]